MIKQIKSLLLFSFILTITIILLLVEVI